MQLELKTPLQSLNNNHKKDHPYKESFETFVAELRTYKKTVEDALLRNELEDQVIDYLKIFFREYLTKSHHSERFINKRTLKGNSAIDTAVHATKKGNSNVEVIIEAKIPKNKSEMLSKDKVSSKALQEAIHYYLYEKIVNENNSIKHIIITNYIEWYIFDAKIFERLFYKNTKLKKQFNDWYSGLTDSSSTNQMYEFIGRIIDSSDELIECTYINLEKVDFQNIGVLKSIYKFFSPRHLLKEETVADSNSLDKNFYYELLHIIGLEQTGKSKKVITRKTKKDRELGSLLENTIVKIQSRGILRRLTIVKEYGNTEDEQLFNLGLELCLTWINRILFLKLLESQLIAYHNGNEDYAFLSSKKVKEFDELETLFFEVLAIPTKERSEFILEKYPNIPYLNSSLFEPTPLENSAVYISGLKDNIPLKLHKITVLKNESKNELPTLDYLLRFLDSYDFGIVGKQGNFKEESKTLISASVLGLIFEKINGYKEGSFYTPSFITMYMCKETIRKSVIQKMNDVCGWDAESIKEVKYNIGNKEKTIIKANEVINSLTICDPAVGSGHFLVSALNELIQIKADLRILVDGDGDRLDYKVGIENDELTITNDDGDPLNYGFTEKGNIRKEAHRVQKTIFYEKKILIENCLFGVDINSNSVKICQLRLWIELLKHTYYTEESNYKELETLPNIDINIKCGNSLISRFKLEDDLTKSFKGINYTYKDYKNAVKQYKVSKSKDEKHKVLNIINEIKNNFKDTFDKNAILNRQKTVGKYQAEKIRQENLVKLFSEKITKQEKDKLKKLKKEADSVLNEEQQIKDNVIYKNAFEWRFEFPEVLDDEGKYIGFDCIIGNPPYLTYHGRRRELISNEMIGFFKSNYKTIIDKSGAGKYNSVMFFIEQSFLLGSKNAVITFIIDISFYEGFYKKTRELILKQSNVLEVINGLNDFEDVGSGQLILSYHKFMCSNHIVKYRDNGIESKIYNIPQSSWLNIDQNFKKLKSNKLLILLSKIEANTKKLEELFPNKLIRTGESVGVKEEGFVCETKDINASVKVYPYVEGSKSLPTKYSPIIPTRFFNFDVNLLNKKNIAYRIEADTNRRKNAKVLGIGDELAFKNPKILIRQSCDSLCASYTDKELVYNRSYYSISNVNSSGKSDFSLLYTLGLLNSILLNYYAVHKPIIKNDVGKQPQIRLGALKTLPIKLPDSTSKEKIETLVDQILTKKSQDNYKDITDLEIKIDQLVYQLYDLTEEEIEIIESSFEK